MDGLLEAWQTLKYEMCFDFRVCDVCCTSEYPLPVGEGVWSMCNTMKQADMVHGFQQWQDRCWQVVTWSPSMSTAYDVWHTDTFMCWRQRSRHSLGSAQNCPGPTGLQRSLCTLGVKESHRWWQSSLYGTIWAFLVSIGHVTLIKDSSFGAEIRLITQNLKPEKGCMIEKLSSPYRKKMEALSLVKMTMENCLGTIYMCLFWISLTMVTLSVDCYCGTLSLWRPFYAKGLGYFTKVLSLCMKMPGIIHPNGQLFMAVNLIGYGSVPILCSVLSLSLNPGEEPGWQVIAVDADVKQAITSWLQTFDSSVFTLAYNPWYHCGENAEMVTAAVWCAPSAAHVPCIDQSQ